MQIELRMKDPRDESTPISINAIGSPPTVDKDSKPVVVEVPDGSKIVSIDALELPDGQYITGHQIWTHAEHEIPGFEFV